MTPIFWYLLYRQRTIHMRLNYEPHINLYMNFCVDQNVKYPEFLDLQRYMSHSEGEPQIYGLYAVLVHSGARCHSGHYFCYIKVLIIPQTMISIYQNTASYTHTYTFISTLHQGLTSAWINGEFLHMVVLTDWGLNWQLHSDQYMY